MSILKSRIKENELEEQEKEQRILLKENKQTIVDFIIDNKELIRIDGLKVIF
jgi:hypothetical protein